MLAQVVAANVLGNVPTSLCGGRLSLSSTLTVPTSDLTAQSTIYFLPYSGREIALWDSSLGVWRLLTIPDAGTSLALGTLSSGVVPFDVFAYSNSGTVALELGPAWSSTTARATDVSIQDGTYCKVGDKTRRYLGTFMPTSTTQTEDSSAKRYLWNLYNRVQRRTYQADTTSTWTSTSTTYVAMNGGNANWKHEFVIGLNLETKFAYATVLVNSNALAAFQYIALGLDSTSTRSGDCLGGEQAMPASSCYMQAVTTYAGLPGIGYHFLQALQRSNSATLCTYQGAGGEQDGLMTWAAH